MDCAHFFFPVCIALVKPPMNGRGAARFGMPSAPCGGVRMLLRLGSSLHAFGASKWVSNTRRMYALNPSPAFSASAAMRPHSASSTLIERGRLIRR
jgi:hypothetical protein